MLHGFSLCSDDKTIVLDEVNLPGKGTTDMTVIRHNIVFTVHHPNANNGVPYETQNIHTSFSSFSDAYMAGAAAIAEHPQYYASYRVFSYREKPAGQWASPRCPASLVRTRTRTKSPTFRAHGNAR